LAVDLRVMGIMGLVVLGWAFWRLPETLHPNYRQSVDIRRLTRTMGEVMSNRDAIGYVLALALVTGLCWAISTPPSSLSRNISARAHASR
jgi:DHA1 family bicyclomycin/chloramphenicol resistance-like MFS transporter